MAKISIFKKLFYVQPNTHLFYGNVPIPRFKWVNPDSLHPSDLFNRFDSWGLFVFNEIIYVRFQTWFKFTLLQKWCIIRYKGHNYGGPVGSCSRCGDT